MNTKGIGTKASGYATPEMGPFDCGHCLWFDSPRYCKHPAVLSDGEVKQETTTEGPRAVVSSMGCCNYFRPVRPIADTPFEKVGL